MASKTKEQTPKTQLATTESLDKDSTHTTSTPNFSSEAPQIDELSTQRIQQGVKRRRSASDAEEKPKAAVEVDNDGGDGSGLSSLTRPNQHHKDSRQVTSPISKKPATKGDARKTENNVLLQDMHEINSRSSSALEPGPKKLKRQLDGPPGEKSIEHKQHQDQNKDDGELARPSHSDSKNHDHLAISPKCLRKDLKKRFWGCSMRCLQGLQSGGQLDPDCPNVSTHPVKDGNHSVSLPEFLAEFKWTFRHALRNVHEYNPCTFENGHSVPMVVDLVELGYVVFVKVAHLEYWDHLDNELKVYEHLQDLQGRLIPVCLGMVTLGQNESYPVRWGIWTYQNFLITAYAGRTITEDEFDSDDVKSELNHIKDQLAKYGVDHNDIAGRNVTHYGDRLMLIDFGVATIKRLTVKRA